MKAHLAKVSLALLSTVFLLGCQDLGSGPVGPEGLGPEFGHKGNHDPGGGGGGQTATLQVQFTADDFTATDPTLTTDTPVSVGKKFNAQLDPPNMNPIQASGSDLVLTHGAFLVGWWRLRRLSGEHTHRYPGGRLG